MKKNITPLIFSLMIVMMSVLMNAGHLYAADNILSADSDSIDPNVTGFGK